ncbi:MAG: hypothetical protein COY81_04800 [Candidatus Pacebacteria bacterium CG_4_10_14_0_8_um_filter_43_12]|nr:MAG: hypothetical protein COY81_04800 [Candidatus Pacebacteria bacterium CG_4_10_14_0_8_um_filter_43_12]
MPLRVKIPYPESNIYFNNVCLALNISTQTFSEKLGFHCRTVKDWSKSKHTFPLEVAEKIKYITHIPLPSNAIVFDSVKQKSEAGKKGAIARNTIFPNPGTFESRRKGGLHSLKVHELLQDRFITKKKLNVTKDSNKLAELIGVILGDGSVSKYQVRITLHNHEKTYSKHVSKLIKLVFLEEPSIGERKNIIDISISGKNIVTFLVKKGLFVGNKLKNNVSVPKWIKKQKNWIYSVLRGLFDTDGSIYLDSHYHGSKKYKSLCVAYTFYPTNLLTDAYLLLKLIGFHPTRGTKNRVMLRRREEVIQFFKKIKPANAKHINRFLNFMEG